MCRWLIKFVVFLILFPRSQKIYPKGKLLFNIIAIITIILPFLKKTQLTKSDYTLLQSQKVPMHRTPQITSSTRRATFFKSRPKAARAHTKTCSEVCRSTGSLSCFYILSFSLCFWCVQTILACIFCYVFAPDHQVLILVCRIFCLFSVYPKTFVKACYDLFKYEYKKRNEKFNKHDITTHILQSQS